MARARNVTSWPPMAFRRHETMRGRPREFGSQRPRRVAHDLWHRLRPVAVVAVSGARAAAMPKPLPCVAACAGRQRGGQRWRGQRPLLAVLPQSHTCWTAPQVQQGSATPSTPGPTRSDAALPCAGAPPRAWCRVGRSRTRRRPRKDRQMPGSQNENSARARRAGSDTTSPAPNLCRLRRATTGLAAPSVVMAWSPFCCRTASWAPLQVLRANLPGLVATEDERSRSGQFLRRALRPRLSLSGYQPPARRKALGGCPVSRAKSRLK